MRRLRLLAVTGALLCGVAGLAALQQAAQPAPVNTDNPAWTTPVAPFKMVGPIHYVGTRISVPT